MSRIDEGVKMIEQQYKLKCIYKNHELVGDATAPIGKVTLHFDLTESQMLKVKQLKVQKIGGACIEHIGGNTVRVIAQCIDDMRYLLSRIS